jgi:hypothetical protein
MVDDMVMIVICVVLVCWCWAVQDVASRCLCLLALDRFGDYGMGMGAAVAPVGR